MQILHIISLFISLLFCATYSHSLTVITADDKGATKFNNFSSSSSSSSNKSSNKSNSLDTRQTLANDEESNEKDGETGQPVHFLERNGLWSVSPSAFQLTGSSSSASDQPPPDSVNSNNVSSNSSSVETSQLSSVNYQNFFNHQPKLPLNCSYRHNDVFCDCDPEGRRFSCYSVASVEDVRRAFDHLLNSTRLVYWALLEVHCSDPLSSDEPIDKNTPIAKSFHISYEMFTEGAPRFESVLFVGDCSKPKHYDNLVAVDREVAKLTMLKNHLRMATSCSLLQPKFERLTELTIVDCVVAGDMISSTFSTRCLGQYGTRNEPMQLTRLTISRCNISLVESGAFYNFAELELIDLSHNALSHLGRTAFAPHLYRLRTLRLEHNRLTSLGEDFFEKLPELREVNLAFNRLTALPPLGSSPGVGQVLHLGANPWDCRCRLTWVVLEEPMDSARLIADLPACWTPAIVKNSTLFAGLKAVKETFC